MSGATDRLATDRLATGRIAPDRLAAAGVVVPPLGLGAAAFGNLFSPVSDADAAATVDEAWMLGLRHFDVAPHYGLGLAERRLGRSLTRHRRADYLLSTKVGRLLRPSPDTADRDDDQGFVVPADLKRVWDGSAAGLRASFAESLERLGTDSIDVLYLHDPDENVPAGSTLAAVLDEALPALAALRDEGLVKAVGVGSKSTDALTRAVRSDLVDVVMVAGRYTLLDQSALAELLPACERSGVAAVAVGVLNSGALSSPVPTIDLPFEYGAMPAEVLERLRRLAAVCDAHGVELPAVALQFPLRHAVVAGVVVGARTAAEVRQAVERSAASIPDALWSDLADAGLISL